MNSARVFCHGLLVGIADFRLTWSVMTWSVGWLVRISTNAVMWSLLGLLVGSPRKFEYLLLGFSAVAGVGSWAVAAATWDRRLGTYLFLAISPNGIAAAIFGRVAIWPINWWATSVCTFVLLFWAFGLELSFRVFFAFLLIEILICLSSYFLTVFLGALAMLAPSTRNVAGGIFMTVIMTFCGVTVPIEFWPGWVQIGVQLLPVTHGLIALREVVDGASLADVAILLLKEIAVGVCWLLAALVALTRLQQRAKEDGSLEEG